MSRIGDHSKILGLLCISMCTFLAGLFARGARAADAGSAGSLVLVLIAVTLVSAALLTAQFVLREAGRSAWLNAIRAGVGLYIGVLTLVLTLDAGHGLVVSLVASVLWGFGVSAIDRRRYRSSRGTR